MELGFFFISLAASFGVNAELLMQCPPRYTFIYLTLDEMDLAA